MRQFGSPGGDRDLIEAEFVVTASQAAKMMGLTVGTLDDMRRRGESPGFLLLGRGESATVLYRESAILDWRGTANPGQSAGFGFGAHVRDADPKAAAQSRAASKEMLGDVYISALEVCRKIGGIGKSTLYLWIKKGIFPPGTRVGPRRTAWSTATVDQWLRQQAGGGKPVD